MPGTLQPGYYVQTYLAKVPSDKSLGVALREWKSLGCTGVAFHASSVDLPRRWDALAAMAMGAGLNALAAFGLDSSDPSGKGQRIASVGIKPSCAGLVLDCEGAWESDTASVETERALQMRTALRATAPAAIVIDQPWPVPTMHWSAYPWTELSTLADIRAPQYYFNDWTQQYGRDRYRICSGKFAAAWAKLESRLAPQGLIRPRIATIQGYGWSDIPNDLITCLLSYPTALLWSEPYPEPDVLQALRVVQALAKSGFTGPTAVRDFQVKNLPIADGIVGPKTLKSLGL